MDRDCSPIIAWAALIEDAREISPAVVFSALRAGNVELLHRLLNNGWIAVDRHLDSSFVDAAASAPTTVSLEFLENWVFSGRRPNLTTLASPMSWTAKCFEWILAHRWLSGHELPTAELYARLGCVDALSKLTALGLPEYMHDDVLAAATLNEQWTVVQLLVDNKLFPDFVESNAILDGFPDDLMPRLPSELVAQRRLRAMKKVNGFDVGTLGLEDILHRGNIELVKKVLDLGCLFDDDSFVQACRAAETGMSAVAFNCYLIAIVQLGCPFSPEKLIPGCLIPEAVLVLVSDWIEQEEVLALPWEQAIGGLLDDFSIPTVSALEFLFSFLKGHGWAPKPELYFKFVDLFVLRNVDPLIQERVFDAFLDTFQVPLDGAMLVENERGKPDKFILALRSNELRTGRTVLTFNEQSVRRLLDDLHPSTTILRLLMPWIVRVDLPPDSDLIPRLAEACGSLLGPGTNRLSLPVV